MALALRHAHTAQRRHQRSSPPAVHAVPRARPSFWALSLSSQRRGCTAAHCRTDRPTWHTCSPTNPEAAPPTALDALRRCSTALLGLATSLALVLGPCDDAQAARTGGRVGGHFTASLARKRAASRLSSPSSTLGSHTFSGSSLRRYRAPMSLRLPASTLHPRPLYPGDVLAYPDLAMGIDLDALPLWASLLGLAAANIAGLALVLAVIRNINDSSEPVTLVKIQVGLLEKRPQLQSKLAQLNSMIQVGQQGAWLILEEAVLELLQHQSHIGYASVSTEVLQSKKRAYALFGEMAEQEGQRASKEEANVFVCSTDTDEEEGGQGPLAQGASALWGALGGGMVLGGGPSGTAVAAAKELTVVTIILATRGKLDVAKEVSDWKGLRHTLQQVTGLSSDKIMAIELLWTPKNENTYLTRQQLARDYPDMRPLTKGAA